MKRRMMGFVATLGALFCFVQTATGAMRGFMSPAREMTEQDFRDLQTWGARLLRYQMTDSPRPVNGVYSIDFRRAYLMWLDRKLDHLEQLLVWGNEYGINIVVDNHSVPGGKYSSDESKKKVGSDRLVNYDKIFYENGFRELFLDAWRVVALRFKGRSGIYGYDLMNEPMQFAEPTCGLYPLQEKAIQAIRTIDPDVSIIVETNVFDTPQRFRDAPFLPYPNLIYSVHMYDPLDFTHQGVQAGKPRCSYPDAVEKPFGEKCFAEKAAWTKDGLRKMLSDVRRFQLEHDARIYVGEFSAVVWADGADKWLKDVTEIFAEYGWDWTYHAFREWPAWSIEHESDTWGKPGRFRDSPDNPRKRVILEALKQNAADLRVTAERIERLVENRFRDQQGLIRSAIGRDLKPLGEGCSLDDPGVDGDVLRFEGCPTREEFSSYENSGMVMGAYLVAMTAKFQKTGEPSARDLARKTYQGIRTVYRMSQSVAKGFYCKPWGARLSAETSSDQYVYVMNGLDRYCAIADESERQEIAQMIGEMVRFWIDRGYRYTYYGAPIDWQKCRFLSFCALAYRQTGDVSFRREFERLLMLPEVRRDLPFGIGGFPIDGLKDSHGQQVFEMCPEVFSSAWLSLKCARELASSDDYVVGAMSRIFEATRPSVLDDGTCHRFMVKDASGVLVGLKDVLPDSKGLPPWGWRFLSLRRPYRIGGMQSSMFLAAAIDMAPLYPEVRRWVQENAVSLLERIAEGQFTWCEDPEGVLPAENRWMTRILNGDAVAHWLQSYWTLGDGILSQTNEKGESK